jgi:gluconolactonase
MWLSRRNNRRGLPVSDEAGFSALLAAGPVARKLTTGATWSEGPVWLPSREAVRWSDIPANRILEYHVPTATLSVYRDDVEFTNGRTLTLDGSVVQCSHGRRAVEQDVDGVVTTLVDRWNGKRLNSPNDVVVARDGAIWFTDPPYGIMMAAEGHPGERDYGGHFVFRFEPTTGRLDAVITDVAEPNGLAFSPDESILYVSDTSLALHWNGTANHHIVAYDVAGTECSNGRVFAVIEPGIADGFRVDTLGNVWTSSEDSVQVYRPDGVRLGAVPIPERVGNVCFGGASGTDLFVAATTSLYVIETTVRDAAARVLTA